MTLYYVGIGSNEVARSNCRSMIEAIMDKFEKASVSSLIRTKAHGIDAADYLNAVMSFESDLMPACLNHWCKTQEQALGRIRGTNSCRADMDILLGVSSINEVTSSKVSLEAVEENYYRALLEQLVCFQSGIAIPELNNTEILRLKSGEFVGQNPRSLSKLAEAIS